MGLFGLFHSIFMLSGSVIHRIQDDAYTDRLKEAVKDDGRLWYLDSHCCMRLKSNNKYCRYTYINGDRCLVDDDGRIIYNQTMRENRALLEKYKTEALSNGDKKYRCSVSDYKSKHDEIQGARYRDFDTKKVYVRRMFKHVVYWMDIKNSHISEMERERNLYLYPGVDIEHFNHMQDAYYEKNGRYNWHNYDCYH